MDETGAALQGLAAAGRRGSATVTRALAYLRKVQSEDGGFGQSEAYPSNAQSTAWAVQGIVAAGKDPARFGRKGRSPLAFLASLRAPDGSYRYSRTSAQTPVWVTAQAIAAVRRKALPLRPVPRRLKPVRARRQVVPELGQAKPIVKRAKRAGVSRSLPLPRPSRPAVAAQRTAAAPRDGAESGGSIAGPAVGIALAALLAVAIGQVFTRRHV